MFGLDDEERVEVEATKEKTPEEKKRAPFAYWKINGREYKLKLTTAVICQLEEKFKRNLLELLFSGGGLPPLGIMLTIVQGAMKTWEHGVKYTDVQNLFDAYCENGGTQLTFLTDVIMPVYSVSGFFSETQQEEMSQKLEEVKENM